MQLDVQRYFDGIDEVEHGGLIDAGVGSQQGGDGDLISEGEGSGESEVAGDRLGYPGKCWNRRK